MVDAIIITFFLSSLVFYLLLGGADFGAGMVELCAPPRLREKVRTVIFNAIAPVWEANHMWLILAVVILFVGYPQVYAELSTHLHIPLTLMLLGIIGRGCAFTFRHYDAIKDKSQKYYSFLFVFSSFWSPFFLGVIVATAAAGSLQPLDGNFYSVYLAPWLSLFSLSVGVFMCLLCGTLAAVYVIAESANEEEKQFFRGTAIRFNLLTLVSAVMVFIAANFSGINLLHQFTENTFAIAALVSYVLALLATLWLIHCEENIIARIAAALQAITILSGWFLIQYPVLLRFAGGYELTFFNSHAPAATQSVLELCLVIGSLIIFPFLGFLFFTLKRTTDPLSRKSANHFE